MNKVILKTDNNGICKEFKINDIPLGQGITKLEVIISPSEKPKLIMEVNANIEIECNDMEIEKQVKN